MAKPPEYRIPPLLLLPVIENVFKHQSSKQNNEAIVITITIDKEWLTLTTSNPYDQAAKTTAESGFGIETLRRRLDLLFKDRYDFEVVPAAPIFKVTLRIPLV
jgi:LytS/YehU family sensor histidine kinase